LAAALLIKPGIRRALNARLVKPRVRIFLLWIVGGGLALRMLTILIWPMTPAGDSAAYHRKALQLLAGEEYGQTAYTAPGFPAILAGWYRITAAHPLAAYILGALFGTAAIVLTYDVARRTLSPSAARWAALLAAIMPTLVCTSARILTTAILTVFVLGIIDLAVISAGSGRRSWWAVVGTGAVIAMASLVKPTFLLIPILVLFSWLVQARRALVKWVVCGAVATCVVIPWTVRNYLVLGAFVPVTSAAGEGLFHGLNPDSDGMFSPAHRSAVSKDVPELARDKQLRAIALERVRQDPAACAKLLVRKQIPMWGVSSTNIATAISPRIPAGLHKPLERGIKTLINAFWTALMLLCLRSALVTDVWRRPGLFLGVLTILYFFALHSVFEVQSRYHVPVIPVFILIAAAGMAASESEETARTRAAVQGQGRAPAAGPSATAAGPAAGSPEHGNAP